MIKVFISCPNCHKNLLTEMPDGQVFEFEDGEKRCSDCKVVLEINHVHDELIWEDGPTKDLIHKILNSFCDDEHDQSASLVLDLMREAGMDAMHCELHHHRGVHLLCGELPDSKDMAAYSIISNESSVSYLSGKKASVVCSNILRALEYGDEH
ncbi:MAG: hypothetical protein DRR06_13335 [Gammaproteobacteria bacterium]|nr:MAG: hypothetical protein DRR06_13335 [Gammaproteobacteria bacterium]